MTAWPRTSPSAPSWARWPPWTGTPAIPSLHADLGSGDDDNAAFTIGDGRLRTAAVFDFEAKSRYSIRVRVTDGTAARSRSRSRSRYGRRRITPPRRTSRSRPRRSPRTSRPGQRSARWQRPTPTRPGARFALAAARATPTTPRSRISGDQLRTAQTFDFESRSSYSIRVATTDAAGATFAKALTVTIADANEAPTALALSNATLPENEPSGTTVGDLSVTDVDAGQTHAFTLVAGAGDADNGKFAITGSTLKTAQPLDFETSPTYSIRVRATDDGTPAHERGARLHDHRDRHAGAADGGRQSRRRPTRTPPVVVTLSATDPEGDDVTAFTTQAPTHGTVGPVGAITCAGDAEGLLRRCHLHAGRRLQRPGRLQLHGQRRRPRLAPRRPCRSRSPRSTTRRRRRRGAARRTRTRRWRWIWPALVDDVETADGDLTYEIVSAAAADGHRDRDHVHAGRRLQRAGQLHVQGHRPRRSRQLRRARAGVRRAGDSTTETVSITVDPVNDAPTASPGSRTTTRTTPVALNLAALVDDLETADGDLTYEIVTQPAARRDGHRDPRPRTRRPPTSTAPTASPTGSPTAATPTTAARPGRRATGRETSSTETVSITVDPVNDAPVGDAGERERRRGRVAGARSGGAGVRRRDRRRRPDLRDRDAAGDGDLTGSGGSTHATRPDADFNGSDSFTYRVTDRGDPDNCSGRAVRRAGDLDDGDGVDHGRSGQRRAGRPRRRVSVDEDASLPLDLAALVSRPRDRRRRPDVRDRDAAGARDGDCDDVHAGCDFNGARQLHLPRDRPRRSRQLRRARTGVRRRRRARRRRRCRSRSIRSTTRRWRRRERERRRGRLAGGRSGGAGVATSRPPTRT